MNPARLWLFRLLAAVGAPLLLLTVLEIVLRLAGYGYSTGFFIPLRIDGRRMLVENDDFCYRFFPPDIARMPASFRMPEEKPAGTYRIFILGGSAAMGDPEPAFGAGRYLKVLLSERYPREHFEVINTAITAINSYVVLPIARDCARQHGDLWIIYMGNNEMVGPFGAATVFGAKAPPLWIVRLSLAVQKTRVGQLMMGLIRHSGNRVSWGGMEMFERNRVWPGEKDRQRVYHNFQRNLADIVAAGLHARADILLSTVAVNLKDCPPFASLTASNSPASGRISTEQVPAGGSAAGPQHYDTEAERGYEHASRSTPYSANIQYQWARYLLSLTNLSEAKMHFQLACDNDALPFRADSQINSIIQRTANQLANSRLHFFDAVAALESNTVNGVLGQETFYEHVHFNFDGNYHLARAWADRIARILPAGITNGAETSWASQEVCERRIGLSDWNRCDVLEEVIRRMQRAPLSSQPNNPQRLHALSKMEAGLRREMNSNAVQQTRARYLEAVDKSPDDFYVRENFAHFLEDTGEIPAAIEQWRKVSELIPQDLAADFELGRLAGKQGRYQDAIVELNRTIAGHPSFAPGWIELGKIHAAKGDYERAVHAFGQALRYQPEDSQSWFSRGLALAMLNRRAEAIADYRKAVKFNPNSWQAHFELGGLLGLQGEMAESKTESEAAIRLNPAFPTAHLNLGLALANLGQLDEAERQFEETLRLDPTNSRAEDYLQQTRALQEKGRSSPSRLREHGQTH